MNEWNAEEPIVDSPVVDNPPTAPAPASTWRPGTWSGLIMADSSIYIAGALVFNQLAFPGEPGLATAATWLLIVAGSIITALMALVAWRLRYIP